MIAAWHPWSVVWIVSFVVLGVVLAGPVLSRVAGFRFSLAETSDCYGWLPVACCWISLKAALAPAWQRLLRALAGVVAPRKTCPARADGQAACAMGNLLWPHG